MSCNKMRMRALSEEGNKRADRVLRILDKQAKMLSAVLIGNNIVNLSASAILALYVEQVFDAGVAVTIATAVLTLLILIFGEISPKTYATINADRIALRMSGFVNGLMVILTPFIFIANKIARGFLRIFRVDPDMKSETITEDELRVIVDVSHEEGIIEKEESDMIKNAIEFGDSRAKDVMIPRADMTFVQVDMTKEELLSVFREDMFTRMPVYDESRDEVIGIVNMKDILLLEKEKKFSIRSILREAFFTIESKKTSELLKEMRRGKHSIAIVLDEYGTTSGMITMEDLLEEIVGEIRDEYDEDEEDSFRKISDTEYVIDASMKLSDLNDLLSLNLTSEEEYDSLGGFVIEKLDHLPEEKETVTASGIVFTVETMDNNRIEKVRLTFLPEEEKEDEENNDKEEKK